MSFVLLRFESLKLAITLVSSYETNIIVFGCRWEGSAICRYRISDIVNLFSTSTTLYILNRDSSWKREQMGKAEPLKRHAVL